MKTILFSAIFLIVYFSFISTPYARCDFQGCGGCGSESCSNYIVNIQKIICVDEESEIVAGYDCNGNYITSCQRSITNDRGTIYCNCDDLTHCYDDDDNNCDGQDNDNDGLIDEDGNCGEPSGPPPDSDKCEGGTGASLNFTTRHGYLGPVEDLRVRLWGDKYFSIVRGFDTKYGWFTNLGRLRIVRHIVYGNWREWKDIAVFTDERGRMIYFRPNSWDYSTWSTGYEGGDRFSLSHGYAQGSENTKLCKGDDDCCQNGNHDAVYNLYQVVDRYRNLVYNFRAEYLDNNDETCAPLDRDLVLDSIYDQITNKSILRFVYFSDKNVYGILIGDDKLLCLKRVGNIEAIYGVFDDSQISNCASNGNYTNDNYKLIEYELADEFSGGLFTIIKGGMEGNKMNGARLRSVKYYSSGRITYVESIEDYEVTEGEGASRKTYRVINYFGGEDEKGNKTLLERFKIEKETDKVGFFMSPMFSASVSERPGSTEISFSGGYTERIDYNQNYLVTGKSIGCINCGGGGGNYMKSASWSGYQATEREYASGIVVGYTYSGPMYIEAKPESISKKYKGDESSVIVTMYNYDPEYKKLLSRSISRGNESKPIYEEEYSYEKGQLKSVKESGVNTLTGFKDERRREIVYDSDKPYLRKTEFGFSGEKTEYIYDDKDRIKEIRRYYSDTGYLTTKYLAFDMYGNPTEIINEDGTKSKYVYDNRGRIVEEHRIDKDNNERVTIYKYGTNGLIESERRLIGKAFGVMSVYERKDYKYERYTIEDGSVSRNVLFNRVKVIDYKKEIVPIGSSLIYSEGFDYDDMGRVIRKIWKDSNGDIKKIEETVYDDKGSTTYIRETNIEGENIYRAIKRVFDGYCPLDVSVKGKHYEEESYVRKRTYGYEIMKDYGIRYRCYDYLDRVVVTGYEDEMGNRRIDSRYEYDERSNLRRFTDANGNTTEYNYDGFSRMIYIKSPDGGIIQYSYDKSGRVLSKTYWNKNNDMTGGESYAYDKLGRIETVYEYYYRYYKEKYTSSDRMDYKTFRYYYDNDKLAKVVEYSGSGDNIKEIGRVEFLYNGFGEIINEKRSFTENGGKALITEYTYDLNGNISGIKTPLSKDDERYNYSIEAYNRVIKLQGKDVQVNNISYEPYGEIKGFEYKNGIRTNINRFLGATTSKIEVRDRVENILFSKDYSLDDKGRMRMIAGDEKGIDDVTKNVVNSYLYTMEDWLDTSAMVKNNTPVWSHEYDYDSNGNRIEHRYTDYLVSKQKTEEYRYYDGTNRLKVYTDPVKENGKEFDTKRWDKRGNLNSDFNSLLDECVKAGEDSNVEGPAIIKCEGAIGEKIKDMLKRYEIDEGIFKSIVTNHSRINGSAVDMLRIKDLYERTNQVLSDDLSRFKKYITELKSIDLNEVVKYQEMVAANLGSIPLQRVQYAYDERGNVRVEAAFPTSDENMPYGVLCYVHDSSNRLIEIYLESRDKREFSTENVESYCDFSDTTHSKGLILTNVYDYKGRRVITEAPHLLLPRERKYFIYDLNDNIISEIFYGVVKGDEGGDKGLYRLREYVWLYDMPVAQVVYGKTEFYVEQGGCQPGGGGGCSIVDEGSKSRGFNWIKIVLMAGVIILGVVRVYRGKAGIVEKIVLIGIVVFVMMAPFRYSQASRGVVFYYHNDHLNTPVKMTDEKGNIVWEVVSKHPFGSFEVSSKEVVLSDYTGNSNDSFSYKIENPIRFPGQYDDSDTKDVRSLILNNAEGLYYNYHRWYNPDIGRYMEVDPYKIIDFSEIIICHSRSTIQKSMHRYLYAMNRPIMLYDKDGLKPCYWVEECLFCFHVHGNSDLQRKAEEVTVWNCVEATPDDIICGEVKHGRIIFYDYGFSKEDICGYHCFVVFHEMAHAIEGIKDEDEADKWALDNWPDCCNY